MKNQLPFITLVLSLLVLGTFGTLGTASPQLSQPAAAGSPTLLWDAEFQLQGVSLGDTAFADIENLALTSMGNLDQLNYYFVVTHLSCARENDVAALNTRVQLWDWFTGGATELLLWGYNGNRGPGTDGWDAGYGGGIRAKGDKLQLKVSGSFAGTANIVGKVMGYAVPR